LNFNFVILTYSNQFNSYFTFINFTNILLIFHWSNNLMSGKDVSAQPVVIDNGTGVVKAGFAGDDAPRRFYKLFLSIPASFHL
jgi:hypothetical protein